MCVSGRLLPSLKGCEGASIINYITQFEVKLGITFLIFSSLLGLPTMEATNITENSVINTHNIMADNTCTLTVKTSGGYPARSVKVSTDVSGGVSCIGGRSFTTDSNGTVTLKWVAGCKLRKIYVDGKAYEVDYKDGKDYSITMK